jgi:hypothetical protein
VPDRTPDQTPAPQRDTVSLLQAPLPEHAPTPEPSAATSQTPQELTPMLDVHPAHHAASTWRDFFIHIITIVIGLLIAIRFEQTVRWRHHSRQ